MAVVSSHTPPTVAHRWDAEHGSRPLKADGIDIWSLDLDHEDPQRAMFATLSPDERQRAARMHSPLDGRRYAIGRASLRAILGRYVSRHPGDLRFRYEARGRPVLDPPTDLTFSVAHAGAVGLIAVAVARAVGVDVEPISAAAGIAEIADRYLPPDRVAAIRTIRSIDARNARWVGLWTEVEACAKLDGRGLGDIDPPTFAALLRGDPQRIMFEPAIGHIGMLAYAGESASVSYFAFLPDSVDVFG